MKKTLTLFACMLIFLIFLANNIVQATDQAPFGSFDAPAEGSTVNGVIPVTGWVMDDNSGVTVEIYREEGEDSVHIGTAAVVTGSRPDVTAAYPGYYGEGWQYFLLTNLLPGDGNGSVKLIAVAVDAIGQKTPLGSATITYDNANAVKPFGNLFSPAPGGIISGDNYQVEGWTLTPQPNAIPTDGSTITVYVDGVSIGQATYNIYREDVATMLPGYANSDGAGGTFSLNTTGYADGVHSIQWTVMDNVGNSDGIGSRYFQIRNGAEIDVRADGLTIASGDTLPSVTSKTDYDSVQAGTTATYTFEIQNEGAADLNLTGTPPVSIDGTEFTVTSQPPDLVPAHGSVTFDIVFSPAEAGQFTRDVSIASDDADEPLYTFRIRGVGYNNTTSTPGTVHAGYRLKQNYPNPFAQNTTIYYELPKASHVNIAIYNATGKKVATLINQKAEAGSHTTNWDAAGLPPGIYLCKMRAGGFTATKKCTLTK